MSTAFATRPRPKRPRALRGALAALSPLLLVATLALLAVETTPRIANPGPPDARAASHTRDVADSLRYFVASQGAAGAWSAGEEELNAVLAAAQRLVPGSYGLARVGDDALVVELSIGAPVMPAGLWANLHLALAPSEDGLEIASARIGRLPVPPALARAGLRFALDRKLGDRLGTEALASIAGLRLAPPEMTLVFDFDAVSRVAFFERLRSRALEVAGATARDQVYVQLWHFDRAVHRDRLPRDGSMIPYVRKAINVAGRQTGADREELRAALYALALYCGDPDFGDQIGVTLRESLQGDANGCDGTTLGGRDDFKRHFVISAGLQAATASSAAFGMGELKELLDSNEGGSGFSFKDMVADAAGVRFARTFLEIPRDQWPALLNRIRSEDDLLPAFDDLPEHLSEAEFRARYGDVDSAAYAAMVREIEARVDALPLYAGEPAG